MTTKYEEHHSLIKRDTETICHYKLASKYVAVETTIKNDEIDSVRTTTIVVVSTRI